MSYTYLATSKKSGLPLASFPRKHELERWCGHEFNRSLGFESVCLFRVRSYPWELDSIVVELEYWAGLKSLIEKTP